MRRVDAAPCGARCHSRNTTLAARAFLSRRESERIERLEAASTWSNVRRLHHKEMNRYKFSHNLAAERRWLEALVEQRRATPVCF